MVAGRRTHFCCMLSLKADSPCGFGHSHVCNVVLKSQVLCIDDHESHALNRLLVDLSHPQAKSSMSVLQRTGNPLNVDTVHHSVHLVPSCKSLRSGNSCLPSWPC